MRHLTKLVATAMFGLCLWAFASSAQALSLVEKAELQAAMQRHVDRQSVEGTFPALDGQNGDVLRLHPVTAHPMILKMGEDFVLCFDFRDDEGTDVPVDFYMTRKNESFVVYHTAARNRPLLHRLMKAGKVSRVD